MAEQYASEEDRALWAARREVLFGMLRQAFSRPAGLGAELRESNGWVFDAALGRNAVQATLNKPLYSYQFPETVIVLARAYRRDGVLPAKPASHPQVHVAFVPGTAVLTEAGREAAAGVAAWLAGCLLDGPPPPADPGPRKRRRAAGPTQAAWDARARMAGPRM